MNLHCAITNFIPATATEEARVEFSCHDGEDTQMVSFVDSISIPHACFVAMNLRQSDVDAYSLMIRYIDNCGSSVQVGAFFISHDNDLSAC